MTLEERLRQGLSPRLPAPELLLGDGEEWSDAPGERTSLAAAAVLVAVTDRPRPGVLLTRRTEHLRAHAGQVAFPGGRIDPEDAGPIDAALREAEEEIALPRHLARVVGETDPYRTVSGFAIVPVVAVVPPDLTLVAQPGEVDAIFEVPLDHLLDPANHRAGSALWQGRERHYYEILWEDRRIWGATAAMLVNLSRRLRWTA